MWPTAGSLRVNFDRPWGLHYFRRVTEAGTYDAMDVLSRWHGDACAVL